MYRKLELDEKYFNRCNKVLVKSLEGGRNLTREELNDELKKHKLGAEGHRLSYIMMNAELNSLICSGPRKGNQFSYSLLEERVKKKLMLNKEEALSELAERYFKSRGPATVKDLSTWSGLTISDSRKGIADIGDKLQKTSAEGNEYYFFDNGTQPERKEPAIHLLPIYDEYIMGYKDRSPIMVLKKQAPLKHHSMIVCDGQVIGTWKRSLKKSSIEIVYDFFKPLNKLQKESFDSTRENISKFYELKLIEE
jgi:hypothetical protein